MNKGPAGAQRQSAAAQRRRHEILVAGKKVFFQNGYQLASVDRIAEAAGTTKRTVYDHFGSKEALFSEVVALAGSQFVGLLPLAKDLPVEPAKGIRFFVKKLREVLTSPDIVRFQRLVIAEAERQPELGQVLEGTALLAIEQALAEYLQSAIFNGRLSAHDVVLTARLIVDVAVNSLRLRTLMEIDAPDQAKLDVKAMDRLIDYIIARHQPEE